MIVQIDFEWEDGYPPTINHPAEAERAAKVMTDVIGQDAVIFDAPPSASEDFSYMLEERREPIFGLVRVKVAKA